MSENLYSKAGLQEYIASRRGAELDKSSIDPMVCSDVIEELTEAAHNAALAGFQQHNTEEFSESPFEELEAIKDILER